MFKFAILGITSTGGLSTVLSVIVPVYNERETVCRVLEEIGSALKGIDHEIVVIDDGSTDGSGDLLKGLDDIKLIRHGDNCGYGYSIKDGIGKASGDLIAIIDADGTYPADQIPKMLKLLDANQMVVAERRPLPSLNYLAKLILRGLVWIFTRSRVPDLNSGLRVFRKELAIPYMHLLPDGYSFTTTITIACLANHRRIVYFPIEYRVRGGKSKLKPLREFFKFIILIFRLVTYFKPLEVFLPASALLLAAGVAVGLYSFYAHHRVMDVTTLVFILFSMQIALLGLLADLINRKK
jgi:glycosyltransferase involved in cell wall biosynthesis